MANFNELLLCFLLVGVRGARNPRVTPLSLKTHGLFLVKVQRPKTRPKSTSRKISQKCAVSSRVRYKKTHYDVLHIHHYKCGFFVPRHFVVAHEMQVGKLRGSSWLSWFLSGCHFIDSFLYACHGGRQKKKHQGLQWGSHCSSRSRKNHHFWSDRAFWRKPRSMLLVPKEPISATLRCKKRGVVFLVAFVPFSKYISRWSITRISGTGSALFGWQNGDNQLGSNLNQTLQLSQKIASTTCLFSWWYGIFPHEFLQKNWPMISCSIAPSVLDLFRCLRVMRSQLRKCEQQTGSPKQGETNGKNTWESKRNSQPKPFFHWKKSG